MKKSNYKIMISSGLIIVLLVLFTKYNENRLKDRKVVKIGKEITYFYEYKEFIKKLNYDFGELNINEKRDLLDYFVNMKLLEIHSERSNFKDDNLEKRLKKRKALYKKELITKIFLEKKIEDVEIKKIDLKEFFASSDFRSFSVIGISYNRKNGEKLIYKAKKELDNETYFLDVAMKYSDESLKKNDCFLGYFNLSDLEISPEYKDVIRTLSVSGEYSKVMKNDFGYVIIFRNIDPTYDEMERFLRKKVKKKLIAEQKEKINSELLDKIILDEELFKLVLIHDEKEMEDYSNQHLIKSPSRRYSVKDVQNYFYIRRLSKTFYDMNESDFKNSLFKMVAADYVQKDIKNIKKITNSSDFTKQWRKIEAKLENENDSAKIRKILKDNNCTVTNREMKSYYYRHKNEFTHPDFIKLQKIVVSNLEKAKEIYRDILKGFPFEKAVSKFSEEINAQYSKGISAYVTEKKMKERFSVLNSYALLEVIPPMKVDEKYVIYKILDKQSGAFRKYSDVETQIHTKILLKKMNNLVADIIDKYDIKVEKFYNNIIEDQKLAF